MTNYILDGKKPVEEPNIIAWARWVEKADRRVALTKVGDAEVSTVFLGIDHRWGDDGPPLLFETMIFGGEHNEDAWRYSTWEEAETGHKKVVGILEREKRIDMDG